MRKSIWDYYNKELISKRLVEVEKEVIRDFSSGAHDYFDSYSGESQYIVDTITSEYCGWKGTGFTLVDFADVDIQDVKNELEEAFYGPKGTDDFKEWLSQLEGAVEWLDDIMYDFSDEMNDHLNGFGFIQGKVSIMWYDGAVVLMYIIDEGTMSEIIEDDVDE